MEPLHTTQLSSTTLTPRRDAPLLPPLALGKMSVHTRMGLPKYVNFLSMVNCMSLLSTPSSSVLGSILLLLWQIEDALPQITIPLKNYARIFWPSVVCYKILCLMILHVFLHCQITWSWILGNPKNIVSMRFLAHTYFLCMWKHLSTMKTILPLIWLYVAPFKMNSGRQCMLNSTLSSINLIGGNMYPTQARMFYRILGPSK